eukprot:COSAG05_NODE_504_length_9208_cov_22.420024_13_plen_154_part_00
MQDAQAARAEGTALQAELQKVAAEMELQRVEGETLRRQHEELSHAHSKCAEQAESLARTKSLLTELHANHAAATAEAGELVKAGETATAEAVAQALAIAQAQYEEQEALLKEKMEAAVMRRYPLARWYTLITLVSGTAIALKRLRKTASSHIF